MVLRAQPTLIVRKKGGAVMHITTVGIDVAKNVFQLHGVDAGGRAVLSRRVKHNQLLSASAHHWGQAFVNRTPSQCFGPRGLQSLSREGGLPRSFGIF